MNITKQIKERAQHREERTGYTEWIFESEMGSVLLKESDIETSIDGRTKAGVHLVLQKDEYPKFSSFLASYRKPEDEGHAFVGVTILKESGNISEDNTREDLLAVIKERNKIIIALSQILNG